MAEKKEYRIKVQGELIPVTEEIYLGSTEWLEHLEISEK